MYHIHCLYRFVNSTAIGLEYMRYIQLICVSMKQLVIYTTCWVVAECECRRGPD